MKLNTYILRTFFLTISLTMTSLLYPQENKTRFIDKKTVITRKDSVKKQSALPPKNNKIQTKEKIHTDKENDNKRTASKKNQPILQTEHRFVAIKTNVPLMALAVQNLALEIEVHEHISIDFPVIWSISDIERKHGLRTIAFQPEGRWWLKSVSEGGHFLGIHTSVAWFNLKWNDNRYQSEKRPLMGVGISYGYRLPISSHWGAEFNLGCGYANMKYNTYYNIENGARINTCLRDYWGITRASLSLVYHF